MARSPRLHFPGAVHHVISRGNRKSTIYHDPPDYVRFLKVVENGSRLYALNIFAFCLMPNHYHLVVESPRGNLSDAMRYINGTFAQSSNRRHSQTGHVFGGRFRSLLIQRDGYLKRAARYVVRNPVRAQLASDPAAWPWTSHRATSGLEPCPTWLDISWLLWTFKAETLDEARRRYVTFVDAPARATRPRDARVDVYGSDEFRARVRAAYRERLSERAIPNRAKANSRPPLATLFAEVGPGRRDQVIRACRVQHGYRVAEIARFLNVHSSTVSRAAHRAVHRTD
jgi:REP element-mobilizing transposase RayT